MNLGETRSISFKLSRGSLDPAVCLVAAGPCAGVPAEPVVTGAVPGAVPVLDTLATMEMVHFVMASPHQVSPGHCHHRHHGQEHRHGVNTAWLMLTKCKWLIIKQSIENELSLAQTTTVKLRK